MHVRTKVIAALFAAFCLSASYMACAAESPAPSDTGWPTKSWPTSTAEEQGMDSASLARLIETVGTFRQDSLMIIRHGKIVAEAYYAPYVAGISHDLRSVTKSITSTLTAIEIKNGLLDSVDHPVVDLFSDHQIANLDDSKKAMTVQHLLDMTSGIAWREKSYTPDETVIQMYRASNRTEFVLNQPMSGPPGAKFYYNSGNPYLLSALITKKTGHNAFDFATKPDCR
jgi:CubicO group peptidase (beta-lactamase class C family)